MAIALGRERDKKLYLTEKNKRLSKDEEKDQRGDVAGMHLVNFVELFLHKWAHSSGGAKEGHGGQVPPLENGLPLHNFPD